MPDADERAARRTRWDSARRVAALVAVDAAGLGGVCIRARPGPALDRWLVLVEELVGRRAIKVPAEVPDDRLLGGLDLAGTLAAGRPVLDPGLLARADGGLIIVRGAERMSVATAARIAGAMDRGGVELARDGLTAYLPAQFGAVLIDEGCGDLDAVPAVLLDRMAFRIDLEGLALSDLEFESSDLVANGALREQMVGLVAADELLAALCEAADALGIASPRPLVLAARAARAVAACDRKSEVDEAAMREASALVLGPLARTRPEDSSPARPAEPEADDAPPPEQERDARPDAEEERAAGTELTETIIDAVRATLPPGQLLERQLQRPAGRAGGGRSNVMVRARHRGRQVGVEHAAPRGGRRLDVLATLRAAAPWQQVRQRALPGGAGQCRSILVRRDDFRVRRFEQSSESLTIFVVDASGSSALHRLGEAKGAVEHLLAECYVRRDSVALISFRGTSSSLELPPTRSLTRAKRALAGLPGGGGTPLAHALFAAGRLAGDARRRGTSPSIVLLTDCRSNVDLDGNGGRAGAERDAMAAAEVLARSGYPVLLVDTAPRPQPFASELKGALRAQYLALPQCDGRAVAVAARLMATGSAPASVR